ncbi:MAG: ankyrin repeat domain-containing protein, partial [Lentisphaeria bacterium]|nr:ankyrin repeat domain-containing protein [Lentisphaeria bacterium]
FLEHPKINVNLQNHAGETALHYMAKFGSAAEVMKLMIDAGADCNIRDCGGRTPLDAAESNGKQEAAEFLRGVGGKRGSELEPPKPPVQSKKLSELPLEYWFAAGVGLVILLLIVTAAVKALSARRAQNG